MLGKVIVIGMAVTLIAVAGCSSKTERRSRRAIDRIAKKLDLTKEQIGKVREIRVDFSEKHGEMEKVRDDFHRDAISLMKSEEITDEKLGRMIAKYRERADEVVSFLLTEYAEFHAVLTPAQREKVVAQIEKHGDRKGRQHKRSSWWH